jgi:hypothetical protein
MRCDTDDISMKAYFEERMKVIMMRARTKEDLVVMEAMGIGDDNDRKLKIQ